VTEELWMFLDRFRTTGLGAGVLWQDENENEIGAVFAISV